MAKTHRLSPWQLPAASWARISTWEVSDKAVPGDGAASSMHLPAQLLGLLGCGLSGMAPQWVLARRPLACLCELRQGHAVWMLVSRGAPSLLTPSLGTAVVVLRMLVPALLPLAGADTVRHIFQGFSHGTLTLLFPYHGGQTGRSGVWCLSEVQWPGGCRLTLGS